MDEPTGGEIRRGDSFRVGPEGMDHTTVELTEELCRRFQLEVGLANVKLNFHNGRFEHAWLERRVQKARSPTSMSPECEATCAYAGCENGHGRSPLRRRTGASTGA